MASADLEQLIGQEAFKQADLMNEKLDLMIKNTETLVKSAKAITSAFGASSGGGLGKQVDDVDRLAKANEKLALSHSQNAQAIAIANEAARQKSALNKLEAKETLAAVGSHAQLEAKLQRETLALNNLANAVGNQSKAYKDQQAIVQKLYTEVSRLDAAQGKFSKNVGNYAGATFSLSQVIRELPAFTYSAQMGFLAIGNNMPILIDQFKILQKEVGSTGKALKIFAGSIFSFVNIFTIATGLYTIFYKEINAFITGTEKAASAVDGFTGNVLEAKKEMVTLYESIDLTRKGLITKEEFLKRYNETLGKTVGATDDYNTSVSNTLKNVEPYIEMVMLKAKVQELLTAAIERTKDAQDAADLGFFGTAKAQFAKGFADFKRTLNPTYLFSGLFDVEGSKEWYKKQADSEAKAAEEAFKKASEELANFMKGHGFSDGGIKGAAAKNLKGGKEQDRMKELENIYDNELKIAETSYNKGEIDYIQYQMNLLEITKQFALAKAKIQNLTPKENESAIDFELRMSEQVKESLRGLYEYGGNAIKRLSDEAKSNVKGASENIVANAKKMEVAFNNLSITLKNDKLSIEELIDLTKSFVNLLESVTSTISDISEIQYMREMQRIEARNKALAESNENELRFIEQSGFSDAKKEKMRQKLKAETEAKQKQIDRDRVTAAKKQARIQQQIDIAQAVANTALAVIAAFKEGDPYTKAARAIIAGVAGAAQIAKIKATPLPEYAKGRGKGKGEFAIVGEAGKEAIVRGDGKVEITPNAATLTYLNPSDQVISNKDLLMNAAYVKLAGQGTVTTDKLQVALINEFERNTQRLDELIEVTKSKNFSLNNYELSAYNQYKQHNIR
jgi:hypothetical protein